MGQFGKLIVARPESASRGMLKGREIIPLTKNCEAFSLTQHCKTVAQQPIAINSRGSVVSPAVVRPALAGGREGERE